MLCYKNGALARDHVRDGHTQGSYEMFSACLKETRAGNDGFLGLFYLEQEIIPSGVKGVYLFNPKGEQISAFDNPKHYARAIVESQILAMYLHSKNIGLKVTHGVLVTGGGSRNPEILQIISDVFGKPVYTGEQNNSACLGAAFKAAHGVACHKAGKFIEFKEVVGTANWKKSCSPNMENHKVYENMTALYQQVEKKKLLGET